MADITRLVEAGKAFGYEGEELRAFIKDEQNRLRDERAQEREFIREEEEKREVRRREEELEKRKFLLEQEEREEVRRREEELEKRKFLLEQEEREEVRRREEELEKRKFLVEQEREAREHELRKMELAKKCGVSLGQTNPRGPKIPPFDEAHDEIDSYLKRFEIYATAQGWDKSQWAMYLSALLKGRALDVYPLMPVEQSNDFEYLKNALLQRYDLSEESFKRKFRSSKPETGESFAQFNTRLRSYFSRWIELAELEKNYESLFDFMVRDQFLFMCNTDLRTFLAEKRCVTSDEMAQMADWYRNARFTSAVSLTKQNKRQEQSKVEATGNSQSSRPQGQPQANDEGKRCFKCNSIGHLARDCSSTVKCYICDRKGHVARECPKRHKVACILSQEDDDVMEDQQQGISDCGACTIDVDGEIRKSTGSSMPVLEGKVCGKVVSVLRDTGCSGVIVRKSLVPVEVLEGETQEIRLADRSVISVPVAKVEIQTPYYTGKVRAWCFKNPLYDVMVGNIPGALGPDRPAEAVEGEDGQTKGRLSDEVPSQRMTDKLSGPKRPGHCNTAWDEVMCWHSVPAGTHVLQKCPLYVNGISKYGYATRHCDDTGKWASHFDYNSSEGWTNYTDCFKPDPVFVSIGNDLSRIQLMSNIGYGISLASLIVAVLLMLCSRRLHCKSNSLHINLFLAFILRAAISFIKECLFVHGLGLESDVEVSEDGAIRFSDAGTHWQCKLLITCFMYAVSASLMWIFMEGLYLHMLVYKTLFTERTGIRMYVIIGWLSPLIYIIPWIIVRVTVGNELCWNTHDKGFIWIIKGPIILTILVNFTFFINIVRVLCLRMKTKHRNTKGNKHEIRKLAKFSLVLIPLFGVLYIGFAAYPPGLDVWADIVYLYGEMFYNSFQGLLLAVLFCFLNEEVHNEVRRCWYRNRGRDNSFTRSFTLTSYRKGSTYASQTSSRDRKQTSALTENHESPLIAGRCPKNAECSTKKRLPDNDDLNQVYPMN